jgi:hypothetical protein
MSLPISTIGGVFGEFGFKNGKGSKTLFRNPIGIVIDKNGFLYVADAGNLMVRKISPDGVVTTFMNCFEGKFQIYPSFLALDRDETLFVFQLGSLLKFKAPISEKIDHKIKSLKPFGG